MKAPRARRSCCRPSCGCVNQPATWAPGTPRERREGRIGDPSRISSAWRRASGASRHRDHYGKGTGMKLKAIALLTIALLVSTACGGGTGGTGGGVAAGSIKGNITLWHAYGTGGSEETALNQIIATIKTANPDAKITVLQVPFDQVFNKFQTEAAAGGGPDLFTAPNDELGNEVRANLLLALDDKLKGKLDKVAPLGVDGLKVAG